MLARVLCPPDVAQFQLCSSAEFEDKEWPMRYHRGSRSIPTQ